VFNERLIKTKKARLNVYVYIRQGAFRKAQKVRKGDYITPQNAKVKRLSAKDRTKLQLFLKIPVEK